MVIEVSDSSWRTEKRKRPERETGRKGAVGSEGLRVFKEGRKTTRGRAMGGKERGESAGGVGGDESMKRVPSSQLQASPVVLGRV